MRKSCERRKRESAGQKSVRCSNPARCSRTARFDGACLQRTRARRNVDRNPTRLRSFFFLLLAVSFLLRPTFLPSRQPYARAARSCWTILHPAMPPRRSRLSGPLCAGLGQYREPSCKKARETFRPLGGCATVAEQKKLVSRPRGRVLAEVLPASSFLTPPHPQRASPKGRTEPLLPSLRHRRAPTRGETVPRSGRCSRRASRRRTQSSRDDRGEGEAGCA